MILWTSTDFDADLGMEGDDGTLEVTDADIAAIFGADKTFEPLEYSALTEWAGLRGFFREMRSEAFGAFVDEADIDSNWDKIHFNVLKESGEKSDDGGLRSLWKGEGRVKKNTVQWETLNLHFIDDLHSSRVNRFDFP